MQFIVNNHGLMLFYFLKNKEKEMETATIIEPMEESPEKIQTSPPIQVVRVPVKHANLGIRSHAM